MSQPKHPVPAPRTRLNHQSKSLEDERHLRDSTPPIALKSWSRQNSGQNDYANDPQEEKILQQPPPLPAKPHSKKIEKQVEPPVSFQKMTPWSDVSKQLKGSSEEQVINSEALHLYRAVQEYINLISTNGNMLKHLIDKVLSIANNLDKVSKGTKIAGITGGASTAAGGVAAVAGVILAPFTAGVSLALTVAGVGVAAAGGVTGASAAIANKANLTHDKKKIEKALNEFKDGFEEILTCLRFISEGMDLLKHHGLSVLKNMVDKDMMYSNKEGSAVHLVMGEAVSMASEKSISASGLLEGFGIGMDMYFSQDGQKVKKRLASKLAKKLRKIAEDVNLGMDELVNIKDVFSRHV